ncbi:hypothetical protein WN51_09339 [Melipona quadrifasciata]|uniref:Uncharacterized protein n=1 Tax=Melipona quadrifasciata TaxID=166423 RepID=A0A0N0U6S8_9HYME|nr:hypothetical protein WN51_09339 [Melipona quadrifasciata]
MAARGGNSLPWWAHRYQASRVPIQIPPKLKPTILNNCQKMTVRKIHKLSVREDLSGQVRFDEDDRQTNCRRQLKRSETDSDEHVQFLQRIPMLGLIIRNAPKIVVQYRTPTSIVDLKYVALMYA